MEGMRVWADIDLDALASNLNVIRHMSAPGVRIMLVVKADAYGHGAVAVAHHAVRCGIGALGVGTSHEALELRLAGIREPILVLGTVIDEELHACLSHDIQVGLHTFDRAEQLSALSQRMGQPARVHINVDTGMGRLGLPPARALELVAKVHADPAIELAGVMSHLAATDGGLDPAGRAQAEAFEAFLAQARTITPHLGWVHLANSTGIFTGLGTQYDTIRPGLAAYGIAPAWGPAAERLQPVMGLRSQVIFLKDLPAGAPIGYASAWRAKTNTRIATLPIGYADGLPWRAARGGEVLVRGQRAPIVGRISMDYTTIDVGHIRGVAVGDVATLIGSDGEDCIGVDEHAEWAETIPYEIICSLGPRVRRQYLGGQSLVVPSQSAPADRPGTFPPDPLSPTPRPSAPLPLASAPLGAEAGLVPGPIPGQATHDGPSPTTRYSQAPAQTPRIGPSA